MKASLRDYLTIVMAFAAVFLCGYGIGHLVGERGREADRRPPLPWEEESLSIIKRSLELSPEEERVVEEEIARAAAAIRKSRQTAVLDYHRHLDDLYGRLIERLSEPHAARLRAEKYEIEKAIQTFDDTKGPPLAPE
jgi:hypothetical protein